MADEYIELPGHQQKTYENYNGIVVTPPSQKNAFLQAHDSKHLELLNTLIDLQALNIESNFVLPQIAVCGPQLSGKSFVLEAITGIPPPRSENTCMRFVTKVTLRPYKDASVTVTIEQGGLIRSRTSVPQFPPIRGFENLSNEL
jgi:hypothetical protein